MKSLFFLFGVAFFLDEFAISEPLPPNFSFDNTNNREHVNISQSVHSRIINAKEETVTNEKYPWLAQVYRRAFKKKKGKKWLPEWTSEGGVIVTNTMILTCGLCVCDEPYDFIKKKFIDVDKWIKNKKPNIFCNKDSEEGPRNQNKKDENEVYYSIGTQPLLTKETALWSSFNSEEDKIMVIIPDYQRITKDDHPDWIGRLSKNGDIALIKKDTGFNLARIKASRIAFSGPNALESEEIDENLFVRTAARGNRYYDDTEKGGASEPLHSCYTNGAVRHNNRNANHARCLEYSRGENDKNKIFGCPRIMNIFDSFEVGSDVQITNCMEGGDDECDAKVILKAATDNECQTLYNEAIQAINRKIGQDPESEDMLERFKTKAERFNVYKYKTQPLVSENKLPPNYYSVIQCYIKDKVAKYGVCKTTQEPKWGFCSKSCKASYNDDFRGREKDENKFTRYEEVDADYYDDFTQSPVRSFVMLPWIAEGRYDT